jgi:uncharacterized membrane protein YqjE
MLQSVLHLTGLDQKLQALKDRLEGQAQGLIQHGKAVAIQAAIVAGLAAGAAIIALMAIVALLIIVYLWLEPQLGSMGAMAVVAGGLLVVCAGLAIAAVVISRQEAPDMIRDTSESKGAGSETPAVTQGKVAPVGYETPTYVAPPPRPISTEDLDSVFAVAGKIARMPHTGIEPVDNMIQALAPKAEEATKEAVTRAAHLVRYGDRTTVMAILGTAVFLGWAMTKADRLARS